MKESKDNRKSVGSLLCELISSCELIESSFRDLDDIKRRNGGLIRAKICDEFSNAVNTVLKNMLDITQVSDVDTGFIIASKLNRIQSSLKTAEEFVDFFHLLDNCVDEINKIKSEREYVFNTIPEISRSDYERFFGKYNSYIVSMNSLLELLNRLTIQMSQDRIANKTLAHCKTFTLISTSLMKLFGGNRIFHEIEYHGKVNESMMSGGYSI
jgi:hypothetical protein